MLRILASFVFAALAANSVSGLHIHGGSQLSSVGVQARDLPRCDPLSDQVGILSPAPNATLTRGEPFPFFFCSPTYAKTSSREIFVGFDIESNPTASNLIAVDLRHEQYSQNLTFYEFDVFSGSRELVVYEVINSYPNPYAISKFSIPVTINTGDE